MAEPWFCKPVVVGSTPSTSSKEAEGRHAGKPVWRPFLYLCICRNRVCDTPGYGDYVDKYLRQSYYSFARRGQSLRRLKTEWGCGTAATAADCKSAPSGSLVRVQASPPFARVAQSVEHFVGNEEVTGSSPVAGSIFKHGGVAQLVRARGSYPRRHWFESSHRYQNSKRRFGVALNR